MFEQIAKMVKRAIDEEEVSVAYIICSEESDIVKENEPFDIPDSIDLYPTKKSAVSGICDTNPSTVFIYGVKAEENNEFSLVSSESGDFSHFFDIYVEDIDIEKLKEEFDILGKIKMTLLSTEGGPTTEEELITTLNETPNVLFYRDEQSDFISKAISQKRLFDSIMGMYK